MCFSSHDNKCRVPVGLQGNKVPFRFKLNIVLASQITTGCWLIRTSSVYQLYAGIHIECDGLGNTGAVGYSGPTYVAIRSGKQSSSTAMSHFETLIDLKELVDITRNGITRLVKQVLL